MGKVLTENLNKFLPYDDHTFIFVKKTTQSHVLSYTVNTRPGMTGFNRLESWTTHHEYNNARSDSSREH